MHLLLDYAFGFLKLHQVYVHISADNKASIALFEGLGFNHCGTLAEWVKSTKNEYEDIWVFQLINPGKTEQLSSGEDLSDK